MTDRFASADMTAGELNAVVKKLGGENNARRLLRDELEVREREQWPPTWAGVRLGGYESPKKLLAELEAKDVRVLSGARDIAGKIEMSSEQELELVAPRVGELGFHKPTPSDNVARSASERGIELVSQDAALYVALQAGKQVVCGELYIFAMESVADSDGDRSVFDLGRDPDGELELRAGFGFPDDWLFPEHRVVFSRT